MIGPAIPSPRSAALLMPRAPAGASREPERETEATARPRAQPGALARAIDMMDDATALAASFGLRRGAGNKGAGVEGTPAEWTDRILDEGAADKVAALKALLQASGDGIDPQSLRQAILQLFPDASDAYAALCALFSDDELSIHRRKLAKLLEAFESEEVNIARGGANVTGTARAASARARAVSRRTRLTTASLREAYRMLLGSSEVVELYAIWLEAYGPVDRQLVLDFLTEALTIDMLAVDPSCSEVAFGRLLSRFRLVACLRGLDERFCGDADIAAGLDNDPVGNLIPLLESLASEEAAVEWVSAAVRRELRRHGSPAAGALCRALRRFFKSVASPDVLRNEVRAALIQALDNLGYRLMGGPRTMPTLLEV